MRRKRNGKLSAVPPCRTFRRGRRKTGAYKDRDDGREKPREKEEEEEIFHGKGNTEGEKMKKGGRIKNERRF